jgi:threonine dehydratase
MALPISIKDVRAARERIKHHIPQSPVRRYPTLDVAVGHSLKGAGTMTLEILEEVKDLDAIVLAVGGGSQAVGAIAATMALSPSTEVYAVQARDASAIHDAWVRGIPVTKKTANTFADGIATRSTYELTFDALREHLAGFVKVSEAEIAAAVRMLLRTTHNLVEGAGAAGLAGLMRLRQGLAGQRVAIVLSGGNIVQATLVRVLTGDLSS